jgi:beta-phosphoglucomutase
VLFDLDGVIVDSRDFHMQAWKRWARDYDIAHAPSYFHDMFGRRNDAIIGGLLPDILQERLQELALAKEERFRALARGNLVPLAGVVGVLNALDELSLPRAIVTSTPRENLAAILESLRLPGEFGALVAEEDAARGKPHPEGFLVAAARLGCEPGRCVVIEDAPAGLVAARAGGMAGIGVTTTHPAEALADASLVVDALDDARVLPFVLSAGE